MIVIQYLQIELRVIDNPMRTSLAPIMKMHNLKNKYHIADSDQFQFKPTNRLAIPIIGNFIFLFFMMFAVPNISAAEIEDGWAAFDRGDYITALAVWRSLAEEGNAEAQFSVANMYLGGAGVSQNYEEASRWLILSGSQGFVRSQVLLSDAYFGGFGVSQNYGEALRWARLAADQNNPEGQNRVGKFYALGIEVQKNGLEAYRWFRLAADQGLADAQYGVAVVLSEGLGVEKDEVEATKWLQMASDQGHSFAQNDLGVMYLNGIGVQQDPSEALKLFRLSADQNFSEAQNNLGGLYAEGIGTQRDLGKAAELFRLSADQGLAKAQHNLGFFYEAGNGVSKDLDAAEMYYRLAANQGYLDSIVNLGALYLLPDIRNEKESKRWLEMAAERNSALAQYNLGLVYYFGDGVGIDKESAVQWFKLAAEQGHKIAQYNLAMMYNEGDGVQLDRVEAFNWLEKSAENGYIHAQIVVSKALWNEGKTDASDQWLCRAIQNSPSQAVDMMQNSGLRMPACPDQLDRQVALSFETSLTPLIERGRSGDLNAQLQLATAYSSQLGESHSIVTAYAWWTIAADQGSREAVRMKNQYQGQLSLEEKYEAIQFAKAVILGN